MLRSRDTVALRARTAAPVAGGPVTLLLAAQSLHSGQSVMGAKFSRISLCTKEQSIASRLEGGVAAD